MTARTRSLAWLWWLLAFAITTIVLLALRSRLNEAHVALAYLLLVQGASAHRGRVLGLTVAALAFVAFDFFFLQPFGTLFIAYPIDWIVLIAFLLTSVVAAQLFQRAREKAEIARQLAIRDAVMATMSHDLRTPLTAIRALAHDLKETGDERALMIEEEAERLARLVGDLLDLSRLRSGTEAGALQIEPNEAEDLIGAALQRVTGTIDGRDIRVSLDAGEPLLFGRFDFAQTLRALVNLIENAHKYSPAGAPIDLAVRREPGRLAFSVSDRGPGILADQRGRIFEPFYRPPGIPRDTAGTGLGLSIARTIAEAQGGSLELEPRDGGGSVFTLRVPSLDVKELTGE